MGKRYSYKEFEKLKNGSNPNERTRQSVLYASRKYGFSIQKNKRHWDDVELLELRKNTIPYGRSLSSARSKAFRLGISFKPLK